MNDAFHRPPDRVPTDDDVVVQRLEALHDLLRRHGLSEVRAAAVGTRQEIAALAAPVHLAGRLAELATAIKELGFLYVTLDLDSAALDS